MSKLQLNAATIALAETVRANVEQNEAKDTHTVSVDLFGADNLPEGLTEDNVKAYREHASNVSTAVLLVGGELSIEGFKADEELKKAYIVANSGDEELTIRHTRSNSGVSKIDGKESNWENFNTPLLTLKTSATAKKSQLGRVIAFNKAKGKEALS